MAGEKTIGRYEIQSEIGRGGMATVYLAYDPNFRRNVAIKLVSGNLQENSVFRERFEREAHLIAKIEHPAIVPVYDYGEREDHQLYLVMRYMPGGALTNKLKEGVLTLGYATQIISQIAPALDAVHAQGIVHRDLKPGNILLDGFGNPAISDFGIAHLTVATTDLTGSAIVGTPSYMSPEQVRGDVDLDGRSDVYALGVILFEMLTGRGPFQAKTPLSLAMKHLTDHLPSILSFRPDLPIELEMILNKAMAKDREMRYASASELARELRAIPGTTQEIGVHPATPVVLPRREELSTEMDVDSMPVSVSRSSGISEPVISPPTPGPSSVSQPFIPAAPPQRRPNRVLQIGLVAGLMLILFIFCSSVGLFGTWLGMGLPGLSPGKTQTARPEPTITQANDIQDIVLFSDDFSNPLSGWPTVQNDQGGYGYRQDGYHIFVNQQDSVFWAKTTRQDGDASIYVDARPVSEGLNGYYGLMCRIRDDENFYYFVLRGNGEYNIGKYKNAGFQPLLSDVWLQNDAIKSGNQTNRLRADCVGDTLRFYINNVVLGEVSDSDFTSGFSGIVAAALDARNFEVTFKNFLITKADQ